MSNSRIPRPGHDTREPRIDQRDGIRDALARFVWHFDMDEIDEIGVCFTPDAEVIFPNGIATDRSAVVAFLTNLRVGFRTRGLAPWHVLTTPFVVTETPTHACWRVPWTMFTQAPGEAPTLSSLGHYMDEYVLDGDEWRIRRREVLPGGKA